MNDKDLLLVQLLNTRFSHDITGPIGAVYNGVELVEEAGSGMMKQAMELIASSAHEAVVRVQFYRQCYGMVKASGEADVRGLRTLIKDFFSASKTKLEWGDGFQGAVSPDLRAETGRLLLNAILFVSTSLLVGGVLRVDYEQAGKGGVLSVNAEGNAVKVESAVLEALVGDVGVEALTPRSVQAYYLRRLIQCEKATFDVKASEERCELQVVFPA